MLGEVPISVIMPPISEPKASGMRNCDGERPLRSAAWIATGRKIASAPTFFIIAERTVTAATRTKAMRSSERISGAMKCSSRSMTPDLPMAVLTTSTDAISGKSGLLKPLNALLVVTMPQPIAASSATNATRS